MLRTFKLFFLALMFFVVSGCQELIHEIIDDRDDDKEPTKFMVTIENVSEPGLIDTDRANGIVPLSPGVYALYKTAEGARAVFAEGSPADEGTKLIAEDGVAMPKADQLASESSIASSGIIQGPNGPILPGEPFTFEIEAKPGYYLQILTMFVQSNDWFYSFEGFGLPLFDGYHPVSGDVTKYLALYDAGTEEDTAPGTGPFQVLAQEPGTTDVGPDDAVSVIRSAKMRHPDFDIPPTASVIKVTVTPK